MKHIKILAAGFTTMAIGSVYLIAIYWHFRFAIIMFQELAEPPDQWIKPAWIDVAAGIALLTWWAYTLGKQTLAEADKHHTTTSTAPPNPQGYGDTSCTDAKPPGHVDMHYSRKRREATPRL